MPDPQSPIQSLACRAKIVAARARALLDVPMLARAEKATGIAKDSTAIIAELADRLEAAEAQIVALTPYVDQAEIEHRGQIG